MTTYQADATYASRTEYDTWGRMIRERHQRGAGAERVFERRYNGYGHLFRIERGALALWQATAADAAARITAASLGNGLNVARSYNRNTGRLSSGLVSKQGGTVLQEGYSYDALGNVSTRTQYWTGTGFDEAFTYDALNRLTSSTITGQPQQSFTYDDIGNLTSKTGVGTYLYPASGADSVRPHAVSGIGAGSLTYDANGNLLMAPGRSISWTWTSFDMPLRATKGSAYSDFVYGADRQRVRQARSDGTVIYYAGAMETEVQGGTTSIKTYWPMGLGVEIERNGTTFLNWTHLDRLGSVVAITDETGASKEQLAYDAWGIRRNLTTVSTPSSLDGVVDNKGYTGHEMLDQIDVVHMNGRIYDPLLARFMSADPLIQDPTHSQSYNRYSYVWNNPTNLTDPSGFAVDWGLVKMMLRLNSINAQSTDDAENGGNAEDNSAITATPTLRVDAQKEFNRPGRVELLNSYNDSLELGINVIGFAEGGIGLARAAPGLWAKFMTFLGREADDAALAGAKQVKPGEFSVSDWAGYPAGVPKPNGPFRLLGGEEYQAARQAANAANKELRKDIQHVGQFDIHEIAPVKFNGSPTSIDNKIILDRSLHRQQVTPWWNALQKALEKVPSP